MSKSIPKPQDDHAETLDFPDSKEHNSEDNKLLRAKNLIKEVEKVLNEIEILIMGLGRTCEAMDKMFDRMAKNRPEMIENDVIEKCGNGSQNEESHSFKASQLISSMKRTDETDPSSVLAITEAGLKNYRGTLSNASGMKSRCHDEVIVTTRDVEDDLCMTKEPVLTIVEQPQAENGDYLERRNSILRHPHYQERYKLLIDSFARAGFKGGSHGIKCIECRKEHCFQHIEQTFSKDIVWHEVDCSFKYFRQPCAHCASQHEDSQDAELCVKCGQEVRKVKAFVPPPTATLFISRPAMQSDGERAFLQLNCATCRTIILENSDHDICLECGRRICMQCTFEGIYHGH